MDIDYRFDGDRTFIEVEGETYEFSRILQIPSDPYGVNEALSNHAALFAYWALLLVEAEGRERQAKDALDYVKGLAYVELKNTKGEGRAPSDETVKAMLNHDERVVRAKDEYLEASIVSGILKSAVESLRQRGQLLQTFAANIREESRQEALRQNY